MAQAELNATVVKRIDVTSELVRLFVKPDKPAGSFKAGQYVALGLPGSAPRPSHFPPEENPPEDGKIIKRAYSIGSPPSDPSVLEFYYAILPQGALTARLACLQEGDRLFIAPKITGTFTLEAAPPEADLVFVSTGTGIAPFISMLCTPSTWANGRRVRLVHGVRYPQDLAYREEIKQLASEMPLEYFSIVSRAQEDWAGHRGHVQSFIKNKLISLDPLKDHVFLCGNPAMIEDMQALLTPIGYVEHTRKKPGNLHLEKYW